MNRYSKIKLDGNPHKSRSMDLSDLTTFHEKLTMSIQTKTSEPIQINKNPDQPLHDLQEEAPEKNHGSNTNGNSDTPVPNFGLPKLTINGSVSSSIKTASKRFRFDSNKQSSNPTTTTTTTGGMQSVVKRAFSMRRSSSVSERYCRIHDQCVTLASSPLYDDDDDGIDENNDAMHTSTSVEKKKKKQVYSSGRLLKACKRFLRL